PLVAAGILKLQEGDELTALLYSLETRYEFAKDGQPRLTKRDDGTWMFTMAVAWGRSGPKVTMIYKKDGKWVKQIHFERSPSDDRFEIVSGSPHYVPRAVKLDTQSKS